MVNYGTKSHRPYTSYAVNTDEALDGRQTAAFILEFYDFCVIFKVLKRFAILPVYNILYLS